MWMLKNSNLIKSNGFQEDMLNEELQKFQNLMLWKFNSNDIFIITKTGFYLIENNFFEDNSKIDLDLGTTITIIELDSIVSELPWKHLTLISEDDKDKKYRVRICHLLNDSVTLTPNKIDAVTKWANTKWNWMIDKLEDYKKLEINLTHSPQKIKENIDEVLDINKALTYEFDTREQYISWLEKEREKPENENDYRYTFTNETGIGKYITVYVFKNAKDKYKNACLTCDKECNVNCNLDCANCGKCECCGRCNFFNCNIGSSDNGNDK